LIFTSESVSEGHPDKVADQIPIPARRDSRARPHQRVAAETLVTTGLVVLAGRLATSHAHDYGRVAREAIRRIGYNDPELLRRRRLRRDGLLRSANLRHRARPITRPTSI
jgi:S-adenosylmethionine synthetase